MSIASPEVTATPPRRPTALIAALVAILIIPINVVVWFIALDHPHGTEGPIGVFLLLAALQFLAGLVALITGLMRPRRVVSAVFGGLAMLGALAGSALGVLGLALGGLGGAWGRPLRIRGRQLHPELRVGSDWTRGARPDPSGLSAPTRRALEALWLHDAQKEHASVPAFSRISWLLAAVGAPADLMEWCHRAALEEIEHTRLCFALAAGYAGRSHTVEPMPELLGGGLDVDGHPLAVLAAESLADGCQLEDYNADVAAACAEICEEPATRSVLQRIAREERTHANFSWALLQWLLERDRACVAPAIERALAALAAYARPTAVSARNRRLIDAADPAELLRCGRLPDERWGRIWSERLVRTRERAVGLLDPRPHPSVTGKPVLELRS